MERAAWTDRASLDGHARADRGSDPGGVGGVAPAPGRTVRHVGSPISHRSREVSRLRRPRLAGRIVELSARHLPEGSLGAVRLARSFPRY